MWTDTLLVIGVLFGLLATRVPVALALAGAGFLGLVLSGQLDSAAGIAGANAWKNTITPLLVTIPLFTLMAALLARTRLIFLTFKALEPWTVLLPGRLLHINTLGSTLVAAVTGSTTASCTIMTLITYEEMVKRRYPIGLILGSLGGPTTIGVLIPPSIPLILYGVMTKTSILQLWTAGIVPGLVLAVLFSIYIAVATRGTPASRHPVYAARAGIVASDYDIPPQEVYTWGDRLRAIPKIVPLGALVFFVIGSLYAGIASPSEAAAWGSAATIILAALFRDLSWKMLWETAVETARVSSMVMLIVVGAVILGTSIGYIGTSSLLVDLVADLGVGKWGMIALLTPIYLVLGMVFEAISMMLLTLPIVFPVVMATGISPLWFGIFITIMVQIAQITPPVGINLFLLSGLTGHPATKVARGSFPFLIIMAGSLALFMAVPQIVEWLPCKIFACGGFNVQDVTQIGKDVYG